MVVIGGHLRGGLAQVINKIEGSGLGWEEAESQEEHRSRCNHIDIAYFWIERLHCGYPFWYAL